MIYIQAVLLLTVFEEAEFSTEWVLVNMHFAFVGEKTFFQILLFVGSWQLTVDSRARARS